MGGSSTIKEDKTGILLQPPSLRGSDVTSQDSRLGQLPHVENETIKSSFLTVFSMRYAVAQLVEALH